MVFSTHLGWFAKPLSNEDAKKLEMMNEYMKNTFTKDDLDTDFQAVSNQSLHDLLEELTKVPHLAGDFRDLFLADWMKNKFLEFGLDHAEVINTYICQINT